MPPRSLPHDVTVERVEDTLVSELKGIVEDDHRFRFDDFGKRPSRIRLVEILLPVLVETFVGVTTISEGSNGIDVERVLALTDDRFLRFDLRNLLLRVNLLRVVAESFVEEGGLFRRGEIVETSFGFAGPFRWERFLFECVSNHLEFSQLCRKVFSPPCPSHLPLTLLPRSIIIASGTICFCHD